METVNEENKSEEKGSFVRPPEQQPAPLIPKQLTIPEQLSRIYEVSCFIGKTLKDTNELLTSMLANLSKMQIQVPHAYSPTQSTPSAPVIPKDSKLAKIVDTLAEFKNNENAPALIVNDVENNMFYIVKTTGFLGTELFAKIARLIKTEFNGEYVSQGKASHFRISKAT